MLRRIAVIALAGSLLEGTAMTAPQPSQPGIPGYAYGDTSLPEAPITLEELQLLKDSLLLTEDDVRYLRMSRPVLEPHVEELVGVWYGFIGSSPHLLASFVDPATGEPDSDYLSRVRERFERWVLDTADAEFDQEWLDYQFEIARRHHRTAKNETDDARAAEVVPYRYIPAVMIPVTTTLRPFLARGGHSEEEVEKMHAAWQKAVLLQTILWSYPYVREGDF